jgi:prepilin-type N-terminal cleavage/methylation domain-containing protein
MGAAHRRGFTLVELLVALVLLLIVGGGMYSLLLTVQRVARRQVEISGMHGSLRTGLQLIQSELQEIASNVGAGTSDILAMNPTSIQYRAMRGTGETCSVSQTAVVVRDSTWSGLRAPASPREGLALYVDGDSTITSDDTWRLFNNPTISASTCPDGSPGWSFAVTLTAVQVDSIHVPGPARTYERMEIGRINDGGADWLGMRSISAGETALIPVVGPITSNGVSFTYYDVNNNMITTPASAVASIVITLTGVSERAVNTGVNGALGTVSDSLSVRVQLRNSL